MLSEAPAPWSRRWFERWSSEPLDAVVLAIGRTFTSTVRLLDITRLFTGARILVVWAIDPGSAFSAGAEDLVRGRGPVVPWDEVDQVECDLVITASENVEIDSIRAPIDVFGHGIGFHSMVPDSVSGGDRLSGVVPDRYLRTHDIAMIVSHQEQVDQLRATHPEAARHCVVLGDTTLDLLVASRHRRARYRRALGAGDRRLIVVTSTWAPRGVYGHSPDIFRRLLAELPYDEYRVAAILHPNLYFGGAGYLERMLADARDAGLIVIPREEGWHAALLAADLVIGDIGSVAMYAASADLPFMRGAVTERLMPGTPPEELARRTSLLSPDLPVREQIDAAITGHRPGRYRDIADRMFAHQGEAAEQVRGYLFKRLGLPVPENRALRYTAPEPRPEVREPQSFTVLTRLRSPRHVEVVRYPRAAQADGRPHPPPGYRSHSSTSEAESLVIEDASVVIDPERSARTDAAVWMRQRFADRPARMAAAVVDGGVLIGTRDGRRCLLIASPDADPGLLTAAAYELLRDGDLNTGPAAVTAGPATISFAVEEWPADRDG